MVRQKSTVVASALRGCTAMMKAEGNYLDALTR
jgi:hypothetical protein